MLNERRNKVDVNEMGKLENTVKRILEESGIGSLNDDFEVYVEKFLEDV